MKFLISVSVALLAFTALMLASPITDYSARGVDNIDVSAADEDLVTHYAGF
ncbi:hypothetical protein C8R44DRAFT_864975 [Mycena epipterygia]|nr:hypothetical protein C8R44DRAFT_864975 [Mycena epipterygia]